MSAEEIYGVEKAPDCRLCRGESRLKEVAGGYRIVCNVCGTMTRLCSSADEALSIWTNNPNRVAVHQVRDAEVSIPSVPRVRVIDEADEVVCEGWYMCHINRSPSIGSRPEAEDIQHLVFFDECSTPGMPQGLEHKVLDPRYRIEVIDNEAA